MPRTALDALAGRAAELAALRTRIEGGDRLVTLTGGPGVGKTRVAEAFIRAAANSSVWTGGRWWVRLSALSSDPVEAVAVSLGLASAQGLPDIDRLGAHLALLGRVLLVVDGLDYGLAACRTAIAAWLSAAPGLVVVATSRESSGLSGEACLVIGPLDDDEAQALFTRLSEAASPGCSAEPRWRESVGRLVRRLDKNPLALECAAARMTVLSPEALLVRLDDSLGALGAPSGPGSERRGLRDVLDETWHALSHTERQGLARLAVFDGPASLDAVEHVIAAGDAPNTYTALECLEQLTRKSLVARSSLGRFFLYETVRGYAADWLRRDPAETAIAERGLASWCLAFVERNSPRLRTRDAREAQRELLAELDTIWGVTRRLAERVESQMANDTAARILIGVEPLIRRAGSPPWIVDVMRRIVAGPLAADLRARLRVTLGTRLALVNAWQDALTAFDLAAREARAIGDPVIEGLALYRTMPLMLGVEVDPIEARVRAGVSLLERAGSVWELAEAHAWLAWLRMTRGDLDEARTLYEMSLAAIRRHGMVALLAQTVNNFGQLHSLANAWEATIACIREAIDHAEADGFRWTLCTIRNNLGECALRLGDLGTARDAFERARLIALEVGDVRRQGVTAAYLAGLAFIDGAFGDAAELSTEAAERLARAWHDPVAEGLNLALVALVEAAQGSRALATATLMRSAALLEGTGEPGLARALQIYRLHLRLLLGELAVDATRAEVDVCLAAAQSATNEGRGHQVVFAATLFEATVGRMALRPDRLADVRGVETAEDALQIAADGTWFKAPGCEKVSLVRKASARRFLAGLVDRHRADDLEGLHTEAAFELGWPGDRTPEPWRSNRVYVLVAKLRTAGLGAALVHDGQGYRLDASVPVAIVDGRSASGQPPVE